MKLFQFAVLVFILGYAAVSFQVPRGAKKSKKVTAYAAVRP